MLNGSVQRCRFLSKGFQKSPHPSEVVGYVSEPDVLQDWSLNKAFLQIKTVKKPRAGE